MTRIVVIDSPHDRLTELVTRSLRDHGHEVVRTKDAMNTAETPITPATSVAPTNPHRELQREMEALAAAQERPVAIGRDYQRVPNRAGMIVSTARASRHSVSKADRKRARKAKWDRGEK